MYTVTAGNVSQFVWYAPYGEALVDEHTTTYENPFKFSGKELDDITGLYDHGARNRNPITAVWYGIDELFENDPDKSPYHYCGGNPVRFVDLDGRDWLLALGYKTIWYEGKYGDTRKPVAVYKTSSGLKDHLWGDFRYATDQYAKDMGPTVEGKYELRFGNQITTKAKVVNGELQPAGEGIESLDNLPGMSKQKNKDINESWGHLRIKLFPVDVKQPVNPETKEPSNRELSSFCFHNSKKGFTHGCQEIEDKFFIDLINYIKKHPNVKKLEVKVKYDNKHPHTYGETDK